MINIITWKLINSIPTHLDWLNTCEERKGECWLHIRGACCILVHAAGTLYSPIHLCSTSPSCPRPIPTAAMPVLVQAIGGRWFQHTQQQLIIFSCTAPFMMAEHELCHCTSTSYWVVSLPSNHIECLGTCLGTWVDRYFCTNAVW